MKPLKGNLPYDMQEAHIGDLPEAWRKEFEAEVADGNFLRGGKSIMLLGEGAEKSAALFHACLVRAGFNAYRITPFEAVLRVDGRYVVRDSELRKQQFEEAECFLIDGFFFDHDDGMDDAAAYKLWWFLSEAVKDGAVLIVASNNEKIDAIDCYPDYMWEFVEETFEVIRADKSEKKTAGANIKKRKAHR